jgi:cystathionine beta-lyase
MDLDALQANLTGNEKAVIFCSPHNPGGRLWEAEEIRDLAAFCARNDLVLVSDEIHMDLTFPGQKHWPTAVAAPECLDRLVVLTAASKGFNIAGGEAAVAIIPDPKMKARFDRANAHVGGSINRFGMQMLKTAFAECGDWSEAVRAYLAENFVLWRDRVSAIPGITVMDMPSTYLTWVDFSGTGMSPAEIDQRVGLQARLAASPGTDFGTGGELCKRFNIAKPRHLLVEAIERLEAAFSDLQ